MGKKKKDIEVMIKIRERRIDDLDDAIEGKLRVTNRQMSEMISRYISPSMRWQPTDSEMADPEIRWLAMMGYMAETLHELSSLKKDLAAMESKVASQPLPMIPIFDNEAAEDERRFVSCYVEWRCMR